MMNIRPGILICMFAVFLSACGMADLGAAPTSNLEAGAFPVDPLLSAYYEDLGGAERLGGAISPLFGRQASACQYMENALLCMDPNGKTSLGTLGVELAGRAPSSSPGIFPAFAPLYNALMGESGRALTAPLYNYKARQVEQHFEALGFSLPFDDPQGKVSLLPYGRVHCPACRGEGLSPDAQEWQFPQLWDSPFLSALNTSGGAQLLGMPLAAPWRAADGGLEQAFENGVAYASADDLSTVRLRPLPQLLGMVQQPPGPRDSSLQGVTFYELDGGQGYAVPLVFDAFLRQHGGLEFSGNPIAGPMTYAADGLPRQCFSAYCLEYHASARPDFQVRPSPLGREYLQRIRPDVLQQPSGPALKVSESLPHAAATSDQVLHVLASPPQAGVPVHLVLYLPHGVSQEMDFPPTAADGSASLKFSPPPGLENGDVVSYRACSGQLFGSPVCAYGAYFIWE